MSPDLDKKLCDAFPLLYGDRDAPMSHTSMCWGFPGDGWFQIIWDLSARLESLIALQPEGERAVAVQVKEKYGTLRFYMHGSTDQMQYFVNNAENLSAVTCETCGAPGRTRGGGWIVTLCDTCVKI